MRVAEKLRLLQNATVDELPSHVAVHVAWRVLPQIVAVVEAAEYVRDGWLIIEADNAHLMNAVEQLDPALDALDEALSPPTGGSP